MSLSSGSSSREGLTGRKHHSRSWLSSKTGQAKGICGVVAPTRRQTGMLGAIMTLMGSVHDGIDGIAVLSIIGIANFNFTALVNYDSEFQHCSEKQVLVWRL